MNICTILDHILVISFIVFDFKRYYRRGLLIIHTTAHNLVSPQSGGKGEKLQKIFLFSPVKGDLKPVANRSCCFSDCNNKCSCKDVGEKCYHVTGDCLPCSSGTFGEYCSKNCSCNSTGTALCYHLNGKLVF